MTGTDPGRSPLLPGTGGGRSVPGAPGAAPGDGATCHARDVTRTPPVAGARRPDELGPDRGPRSDPGAGPDSGPRGTVGRAVRRALDRAGVRSETGRDTVLAVAWALATLALLGLLLAYGEFYGVTRAVPSAQVAVTCALAVVQCLPLALRRRSPVVTLLVVAVLQAALLAVVPRGIALWGAAPLVAAFTVGTLLPARRTVAAVAAALGVTVVGAALGATGVVRSAFSSAPLDALSPTGTLVEAASLTASGVVVLAVAAAVGSWTSLRRAHDRDVRARASEAVEHQATRTRAAVAAERTRMARELHDVAAHHLTGLVVQAGAAERLVDVDPERAKQSLRTVRAQGRETLDALRSIVGILRETGEGGDGTTPVPGLADVPGLVDAARASGTDVVVTGARDLPTLAPLADVTAYRTVQEGLANARRHAPGERVTLELTVADDVVGVVVENALPAGGAAAGRAGYGLVGMRERAALVGGGLEAGPTASGTWRVRLTVPTEPVPSAAAAPAAAPARVEPSTRATDGGGA